MYNERVFVAKDVILVNFMRSACLTININGTVVKQSNDVLRIFNDEVLTIVDVSPFSVCDKKKS